MLLLLDEPSTGLDPGARHDLWRYLKQLQSEANVTVLVTTHLMEEAEHCDRLGILDRGELVALGTPAELRAEVGGDCLTIHCGQAEALSGRIRDELGLESTLLGDALRIERNQGHQIVGQLVERYPEDITSISLGKPTLEDVFIAKTGHQFWDAMVAEDGE
jgi:ABC-2 type transport system ATP-binding protein